MVFVDIVLENICYGNLEVSDEVVISVVKKVFVYEFIDNLDECYNM